MQDCVIILQVLVLPHTFLLRMLWYMTLLFVYFPKRVCTVPRIGFGRGYSKSLLFFLSHSRTSHSSLDPSEPSHLILLLRLAFSPFFSSLFVGNPCQCMFDLGGYQFLNFFSRHPRQSTSLRDGSLVFVEIMCQPW